MLTMAILSCIVFLVVLVSSYWWGYHSRFSLGSKLVDAKENTQGEGSSSAARSSSRIGADSLEFDYVFERSRSRQAQASVSTTPAQSSAKSSQAQPNAQATQASNGEARRKTDGIKVTSGFVADTSPVVKASTSSKSTVVSLQAHRASKQAELSAQASSVASSEDRDDLKKIWGIGVVFENLLNSKGVYTFEQLANISDEVKEDVRASLGIYSNRIERDEWLSQATAFFDSKNKSERIA